MNKSIKRVHKKSKVSKAGNFIFSRFSFVLVLIVLIAQTGLLPRNVIAADATLTLNAVVSGGSASQSDFIPVVEGAPVDWAVPTPFSPGLLHVSAVPLVPDYTYALSGDCDGIGRVTVNSGDNASCTLTFTFGSGLPAPFLTGGVRIVTEVVGGSATAANFTQHAIGTNPSQSSVTGTADPGFIVNFEAGSFEITQDTLANYSASFSADCQGSISLGSNKVCTITNTYSDPVNQASLTVINHVINDNGNTYSAGDFTINVTGTNVSSSSFVSTEAPGTTVTLDPGSYSVVAIGPAGYSSTYAAGCSGSLAAGDSQVCNITTDDLPGLLIISAIVNNNGSLNKTASDFTVHVDAVNPSVNDFAAEDSGTWVYINPGAYSVDEVDSLGYNKTFGGNCSGSINFGQVLTCSIINTDPGSGSGPTDATLTLTLSNGENDGKGTITGPGINCDGLVSDSDCSETYTAGTVISLTAVAHEGSSFEGSWTSGPCAGTTTNPCSVTVSGNMTINAHFSIAAVNNPSNPGGSPSVTSGGSTFTASPTNLISLTPPPASNNAPQGQVLGNNTLPRTGLPIGITLLVFSLAAALLNKKFKLV